MAPYEYHIPSSLIPKELLGEPGKKHDPVNHPSHYTQGPFECISALKSCLSPSEFLGFLRGNAMKYLWRAMAKTDAKQDLEKAHWYLNALIKELQEEKDK